MAEHTTSARRIRILFVAEAVTLAHVARPVTLARSLDPQQFEVHLAHHPRYRELMGELPLTEHEIHSISPQQFMQALASGSPVYDLPTLSRYVEEDLELIAEVKPDIIVGDFRLSLAVSATLTATPYVALSNAYWSPYSQQDYTVPDLPLTRILGTTIGQGVFSLARPFAFALHCLPMHRLRRRYGLPSLGFDLRRIYTHADYTLYADIPELYQIRNLPARHRFIGPVVWSPADPHPDWWQDVPQDDPIVYVTLGSSGNASLLPRLIAALGEMRVTALVSTAGTPLPSTAPKNIYMAPYLPGEEAVKLASLVICNGGSPTTHQALKHGVPVIGVANNLDQYLNMNAIAKVGAGYLLRAGKCDSRELVTAIKRVLADSTCLVAAQKLAERLAGYSAPDNFTDAINEISGVAVLRNETNRPV
ncbi:PGL/p-HBAD biosynthesis glycosyltransferase [Halioglobus japonicus]|nr:PGL/p-HBAD biosynthesis glycosyltransferase [Halioglobus japonicus]